VTDLIVLDGHIFPLSALLLAEMHTDGSLLVTLQGDLEIVAEGDPAQQLWAYLARHCRPLDRPGQAA